MIPAMMYFTRVLAIAILENMSFKGVGVSVEYVVELDAMVVLAMMKICAYIVLKDTTCNHML